MTWRCCRGRRWRPGRGRRHRRPAGQIRGYPGSGAVDHDTGDAREICVSWQRGRHRRVGHRDLGITAGPRSAAEVIEQRGGRLSRHESGHAGADLAHPPSGLDPRDERRGQRECTATEQGIDVPDPSNSTSIDNSPGPGLGSGTSVISSDSAGSGRVTDTGVVRCTQNVRVAGRPSGVGVGGRVEGSTQVSCPERHRQIEDRPAAPLETTIPRASSPHWQAGSRRSCQRMPAPVWRGRCHRPPIGHAPARRR